MASDLNTYSKDRSPELEKQGSLLASNLIIVYAVVASIAVVVVVAAMAIFLRRE